MSVRDDRKLQSVQEYHIDLLVAQFLDTSSEFRNWFVETVTDEKIGEYTGSACNVVGSDGRESDVLTGFQTPSGEDHLILIENKITAAEQPDQLADYHNRGRRWVQRGDWDSYTVCLIAPERRCTPTLRAKVDSVVSYEALSEQLRRIDHDAAPFGSSLFEQAAEKSENPVEDCSGVVSDIRSAVMDEIENLADFEVIQESRKQLKFTSNHPDHPHYVIYSVYIVESGEYGQTNVRLQIDIDEQDERKRIAEELITEIHEQSSTVRRDYEPSPDLKNMYTTKLLHDECGSFPDDVIVSAATEMSGLVQTVHPILCRNNFRPS